tara:strand:- start:52 stop:339 length:288 start_codon:yes stop_codon:yes gene_type:complete
MKYDHEAIHKAYAGVVVAVEDDIGCFDKDRKEVTIEQSKVDEARVELNKLLYRYAREDAYPSIQDQLDMQYWDKVNDTTTWKDAIAKVKADNPKP